MAIINPHPTESDDRESSRSGHNQPIPSCDDPNRSPQDGSDPVAAVVLTSDPTDRPDFAGDGIARTGARTPSKRHSYQTHGILVSFLAHAVLAMLLLPSPDRAKTEAPPEKTVTVDLVPPAAPAKQPLPKKPEEPEQPKQPDPAAAAPRPALPSAPTKPMPNLQPAPFKPQTSRRAEDAPVKSPLPPTQSERDLVLSQISRHWHPPAALAAYDGAVLSVGIIVRADGSFAPPFHHRAPWNPGSAISGYGDLPPQSLQKQTVEALYRAIRQSQPLTLPDSLKQKAPFPVRLEFRAKDLR